MRQMNKNALLVRKSAPDKAKRGSLTSGAAGAIGRTKKLQSP